MREAAIKRHNAKPGVKDVNFGLGDFVLFVKRVSKGGSKLEVRWIGPMRITRVCSELTFQVEDLISDKRSVVHANRLRFYSDSSMHVTEELLDSIAHNKGHLNRVEKLLALLNSDLEIYEVQVK